MKFDNSYRRLPERFYELLLPEPAPQPRLVFWNQPLAEELGVRETNQEALAQIFSGGKIPAGAEPLAQAYAGHQFGHFQPQLGDGRALLLGEVIDQKGIRRDLHLKGSGRTRFSRRGDGKAALGPMLREVLISESLFALGIPTTRSLAVVATGELVHREEALPGAILTRVAASHLRVGTFEYFAARRDLEGLRLLADFAIDRHYTECKGTANPYLSLLEKVIEAQAQLISSWMQVGFIHGVMNTDNMTISGESIDFGPCAFMDEYEAHAVFSSIDQNGRYTFSNQSRIGLWNLQSFASCLLPLIHENFEEAKVLGQKALDQFLPLFQNQYDKKMGAKLGLATGREGDSKLLENFLSLLEKNKIDFTNGFEALSFWLEAKPSPRLSASFEQECAAWKEAWLARVDRTLAPAILRRANPCFIPRNHLVQKALLQAEQSGDFSFFQELLAVVQRPFENREGLEEFRRGPKEEERVLATFCGT